MANSFTVIASALLAATTLGTAAAAQQPRVENGRWPCRTPVRSGRRSQRAGDKVAAAIRERVDADPDTEVKKRTVFALSQLPKAEGSLCSFRSRARTGTPKCAGRRCSGWDSRKIRARWSSSRKF